MQGRRSFGVAALLLGFATQSLAAQSVRIGTPTEDYLRALQISGLVDLGSMSLRPILSGATAGADTSGEHPWAGTRALTSAPRMHSSGVEFEPIEARIRLFVNSRHPFGGNDGAVWQGKGLTTALDVGTRLRWGALSVTVAPELHYAQNADFELADVQVAGMPEYAYPWRRMDLPQRPGPDPLARLHPGRSEIRVSGRGLTAAYGSRSLWWGPGVESSILMSNNAPGFRHVSLGTNGALDFGLGSVEAQWVWGDLTQSDWFDPAVANDERFLTGLVVAVTPDALEGLTLGLTRVFYGWVPEGGSPLADRLLVFQGVRKKTLTDADNPTGDDELDQMASVFWRWLLPESGFEFYGEWARNDHGWDLTDYLQEPEHSQAYTLGFQKTLAFESQRFLLMRAEITHLERDRTFMVRGNPVYYTHHRVTQGYTHEGQVLGASVGPGGIQQHASLEYYGSWGRAGLLLQRRATDNDAYYVWAAANGQTFDNHDVGLDGGLYGLVFLDDFDLEGSLTYTRQLNRYFYGLKVNNFNLSLSATWRPR